MTNQLGKRFQCGSCGTEVLCIKAVAADADLEENGGAVHCCGAAMELQQPKVLPSAD